MTPPLAVDIDGTLTDEDRAVYPPVLPVLREWDAPVVLATGKALPYPVALCEFAGVERTVVAENGGVAFVHATDDLLFLGDREAAQNVVDEYVETGHELGWGSHDLVNRWRETEVAVSREAPLEPLQRIAADHGLEVVDTGFAYHVKSPDVSKGRALEAVAERLDRDPTDFVAVGDSINDVSTFEVAGRSFAVANADEPARETADEVLDAAYGEGFLEAVERVR
ncbi:phosphoglycolate phosphatase [Halosimplex pelagicum]|uniref:Phosphoglycolate phosphatase n=1 Tax=Halosimplex pelagicum TaxID=869886 RepID=A0A7D5PAR6_9EURY|nr:phosphoglycolate phosphatase [Halosimplex pelagicum]QLH83144.1 phosphoglycolate phosphatase [Halosimplex pelagicum]